MTNDPIYRIFGIVPNRIDSLWKLDQDYLKRYHACILKNLHKNLESDRFSTFDTVEVVKSAYNILCDPDLELAYRLYGTADVILPFRLDAYIEAAELIQRVINSSTNLQSKENDSENKQIQTVPVNNDEERPTHEYQSQGTSFPSPWIPLFPVRHDNEVVEDSYIVFDINNRNDIILRDGIPCSSSSCTSRGDISSSTMHNQSTTRVPANINPSLEGLSEHDNEPYHTLCFEWQQPVEIISHERRDGELKFWVSFAQSTGWMYPMEMDCYPDLIKSYLMRMKLTHLRQFEWFINENPYFTKFL